MWNNFDPDDYDGLTLCPNCGDCYSTNGDLCRACREQEMIDNDPNPPGSSRSMYDDLMEDPNTGDSQEDNE